MSEVNKSKVEELFAELDNQFESELDETTMFSTDGSCGTPCGSGGNGYNYASKSPGW